MRALSWNCRGLGNPRRVRFLQDWCWRLRPNIVLVMETMIASRDLEKVRRKCGFQNGLCLDSNGNSSGGIGLWWDDLDVRGVSYSRNHVQAEIFDRIGNAVWCAVGVYGWPEAQNKHKTWALMKRIKRECTLPILFFGDFNEILSVHEKQGGAERSERCIDAFREAIDSCDIRDLGFNGNMFTWQRGNSMRNLIRERLDRFLASHDWCNIFPEFTVEHLPIVSSDHGPIFLKTDRTYRRHNRRRGFKFEPFWLTSGTCESTVREAWMENAGQPIERRVATCGTRLAQWAKNEFGDIRKQISDCDKKLKELQMQQPSGPLLAECKRVENKLIDLHRKEESYWHIRARANELRDGDQNTAYFHHKASHRRKRNRIEGILDENGTWNDKEEEFTSLIVNYYKSLFSSSNPSDFEATLEGINEMVTAGMNDELTSTPTAEEIFDALSQMHPNKAPGPDVPGAQQLRALELNSWQLLRLLKAQLPGLSCADSEGPRDYRWSKVSQCNGKVEEMLCCLYSEAADLHSLWKSAASSSDGGHYYDNPKSAYYKFLMTASEWLTRRVTEKPFGRLASGILAMLLSCVLFLRLLFCLRREECHEDNQGVVSMKGCMRNWSLDEKFVVAMIIITVLSMGSSSMVEEEQYIWHFVTSTLFCILLRKTMQFLLLGRGRPNGVHYRSRYSQVSSVVLVLLSGRIMRGWHQGGVNWTHLPDIAKWLEQAGSSWIRTMEVLSGILITSMSLFAFCTVRLKRCYILLIEVFYLLTGYLVLLHIMKHRDLFLASGHGATFTAQLIYAVLGISTCFVVLASPWLSHLYIGGQPSCDGPLSVSQSISNPTIHLLGGLKESSYVTGWTYIFSWSLLQLLLQQPINLMPVFLLLLQITAAMVYFSNDRVGRRPWVEVAALYFIGMAGHFSLGNSNTLATIDVAGAFTGISSHSILFSGLLMFCITYASPMLVLLSLVMYISFEDGNHSRVDHTKDFGLLLKSVLAIPVLVPLCINSVLLIAYTVVLLLMRNHLFVWSVFSPKYLYVCATTVCVYIGVCVVAATEIYIFSVCTFRSRRLILATNSAEGMKVHR